MTLDRMRRWLLAAKPNWELPIGVVELSALLAVVDEASQARAKGRLDGEAELIDALDAVQALK